MANNVSYVAFESACSRLERSNKRLFVICIILISALIATNAGWIIYESQYQTVEVSQEVEQQADGDGNNQFIGGDYYEKDSDVIRILAQLADVPHEIHHNLTTVDAPETVKYIKSIPGVIIEKARFSDGTPKTMWNLIPKKKIPPTRLMRWCCQELKEWGGRGRLRITGIRWDESRTRKENGDVVKIVGKQKATQQMLDDLGLQYTVTRQGGIKMSLDNDMARDNGDFLQHCYRDRTVTVNPIVDWTDRDVWDFLHHYGCEGNPLYQCGEDRIGCIGCPLSGSKQQERDFMKYPKYRANYVRAFDKMLKVRQLSGMTNKIKWTDGESVMRWWICDPTIDGQMSFFDDEEIYNSMQEE